jgi:hypothetical protein
VTSAPLARGQRGHRVADRAQQRLRRRAGGVGSAGGGEDRPADGSLGDRPVEPLVTVLLACALFGEQLPGVRVAVVL